MNRWYDGIRVPASGNAFGAVCPAGYHGTSAPLTTKSGEALPNAVYTCARQ